MALLEIAGASKRFGATAAVDDVSLSIEGARRSFASVLAVRDVTLKIEDG